MTATGVDLTAALKALVPATVPVITNAYRTDLPSDESGRVYPYVAVYASIGVYPELDASPLSGEVDFDRQRWDAQVTVASGDPDWTMAAAIKVERALLGQRLVPGASPLRHPLGGDIIVVQQDRDPTPNRWFVPLPYWCMT